MQLKSIFLSIPRDTIKTLTRYHLLPKNTLLWYDLITFFDQLTTQTFHTFTPTTDQLKPHPLTSNHTSTPAPLTPTHNKSHLPTMQKYNITAEHFNLSEEQTRKIIAKLNQYI